MLTNVRSCLNKLHELSMFLHLEKPDLFCLVETWLHNDIPDAMICSSGYNIIRKDRSSRGGGVMILLSDCISYRLVDVPPKYSHIELICIDIIFGLTTWRIIGYYRYGGYDNKALEYARDSVDCLRSLCLSKKAICLLGDFNLPDFNWRLFSAPSCGVYSLFLDLVNELGLHQFVNVPTRGHNILDLVFSSDLRMISSITTSCPISNSDHCVISFKPSMSRPYVARSSRLSYRYGFRKADYSIINMCLQNINWNSIFQHCFSVEACWRVFRSYIGEIIRLKVPKVMINFSHKHPMFIVRMQRSKAKQWKKWKSTGKDDDRARYNELTKNCRKAIRCFYSRVELNLMKGGKIGSLYRYIGRRIYSRTGVDELLLDDGTTTRDRGVMTDAFNRYFSSVFTLDDGQTPVFPSQTSAELYDINFSPEVVFDTLCHLQPSISSGCDGIPNILLKNCATSLAQPLSHIFEMSFRERRLPRDWKIAIVTPIHKKGPTSIPGNYRPISITSTSCRVMERIVNRSLMQFLLNNNLIDKSQHGFTPGSSTVTNILECADRWSEVIQARQSLDVIYLDFKKAFDSVSHLKLLQKVAAYGVRGDLLSWLTDFLNSRFQRVGVEDSLSGEISVLSGVPQGSVLGPTLFLLFINDLPKIFTGSNIICKLFADDVKIYCEANPSSGSSNVCLQSALDLVSEWSERWQLGLAAHKCLVFTINDRGKTPPSKVYIINNHTLHSVRTIRDLGIEVDSRLRYEPHVNIIIHRAAVISRLLRISLVSTDWRILKLAFCTFVRPILEYGSQVWNPHCRYLIDRIERIQKKFTRFIPSVSGLSYKSRLEFLGLQSLEKRRLIADLVFCYKLINHLVNTSMSLTLALPNNYSMRGHDYKLRSNKFSCDVVKYFYTNRIVAVWNSLPANVVNCSSVLSFKLSLRSVDLDAFLHYS